MNLLAADLARVPAAAERLYEIDGADHLLAEQLRLKTFAG